jgi:pimeloyl-ACP methyl ester carboxylesterase
MPTIRELLHYPFEVSYVTLPDIGNIAYTAMGSGSPTLVFLHGLGSNLKAWQYNLPALAQNYRCIAIDLPGFGKSAKGKYPCTMTFFAETVIHLLEVLGIERYVVIGHSMGGQIAMHIARREPQRCEGMALLAPAGFETFTKEASELIKKWFNPQDVLAASWQTVRGNMERNFSCIGPQARELINDRLLLMQGVDYEDFTYCISASTSGMLDEPVFEWLPDLMQPVLIIYGEDDHYIPNRYLNPVTTEHIAHAGASRLPHAHLHMLPACGHFPSLEAADVCNELLHEWLTEITNFQAYR